MPIPAGTATTEVVIDTAVGTVRAVAHLDAGKVRSVTVANVPAFVVELDFPLDVPELGTIPVDIVFGGQFFAQTDVRNCGLDLDPDKGRELVRAGALIKLAALEQVRVAHPVNPEVAGVNLVMLHSGERVPGVQSRNTVVLNNGPLLRDDPSTWTGALDRSPCGTGTCARMAALHARGQLALGEDFSPPQHHRQRVRRRVDRQTTIGTVRRGAAHPHRPGLGDRPLPLGARRDRPLPHRLHRRRHLGPALCTTNRRRRPHHHPPDPTPGGKTVSQFIDGKLLPAAPSEPPTCVIDPSTGEIVETITLGRSRRRRPGRAGRRPSAFHAWSRATPAERSAVLTTLRAPPGGPGRGVRRSWKAGRRASRSG